MKRSIICVFFLLMLAGCRQSSSNLLTEDMFKVTVEKQFGVAKQKADTMQMASLFTPKIDATPVLFQQNESGNGAEFYWTVLKDRIDTNSESARKLIEQTGPLVQVYELAMRENLALAPATIEVVKSEAQQAAQLPELAQLEAGARRKEGRLIGELIPVPDSVVVTQLVPGSLLNCYAAALMSKALQKEAAGDKAAAEAAMQTMIALGNHFYQDANYFHYLAGLTVMKFGCYGLKHFYQRQGDKAKQQVVAQLEAAIEEQGGKLAQLGARDDTGRPFNVINTLGYLDAGIDPLTRIATDENVPRAFRATAIENLYSGYIFRYMMVERSGKPPDTSEYPPPSEERLKAFERLAALPDKTLAQMAGKAQQVLAKMRSQSSGERFRYWQELSRSKS